MGEFRRAARVALAALGLTAAGVVAVPGVRADGAPDAGRAWEPPAIRDAEYQLGPALCAKPFREAAEQLGRCDRSFKDTPPDHTLAVAASDGETIHVEVWVPHPTENGPPVPDKVPVVAEISPYLNSHRASRPERTELVGRGYAFAQVHMRGTGMSSGCFEVHSDRDTDDGARVIEALASAPWSTGKVGLYGFSHSAGAALNAAASGAKDRRLRGLRAVIAGSPSSSPADMRTRDGVLIPELRLEATAVTNSVLATTLAPNYHNSMEGYVPNPIERAPCRIDDAAAAASVDRGPTAWETERDLRRKAGDIGAPTLFTMGLQEVSVRQAAGFFDQIGTRSTGRVRKVGLFGHWGHSFPGSNGRLAAWARADWERTYLAWFDRWLLGIENGVEDWPVVQVQDSTGQWRTEPEFPLTGGPVGQLALGSGGVLGAGAGGAAAPEGSTTLSSASVGGVGVNGVRSPGTALSWETPPLATPLRMTGVPELDLWVTVDRPAGQLVADLQGFDAAGNALAFTRRVGARSLRYLDPIVNHRFVQTTATSPPVGRPFQVRVRFDPTDAVVPAGGRLRIQLATVGPVINGEMSRGIVLNSPADAAYPDRYISPPDVEGGNISVLHDCAHVSALRFLMPRPVPDLIDVREVGEVGDLGAGGEVTEPVDGNTPSLASESVCGQAPVRLESFGPEIPRGS